MSFTCTDSEKIKTVLLPIFDLDCVCGTAWTEEELFGNEDEGL